VGDPPELSLLQPLTAAHAASHPQNAIPKETLVRFITLYLRMNIPRTFASVPGRDRARVTMTANYGLVPLSWVG
jgi:hypothetical protein